MVAESLIPHTVRLLAERWGFNGLAVCYSDAASWTTWPVGVIKVTSYLHIAFILIFTGHAVWLPHNPAGHALQLDMTNPFTSVLNQPISVCACKCRSSCLCM
jgi:hypothetical protein